MARYWDGNVDVDGTMKTYTLNTNITQTWETMKLGFEVAADTADLIIDNVSLVKVDSGPRGADIATGEGTAGSSSVAGDFGWQGFEVLKYHLNVVEDVEFYGVYRSPLLDLSGLDSTKLYRMKLDYDNLMRYGYKEPYYFFIE